MNSIVDTETKKEPSIETKGIEIASESTPNEFRKRHAKQDRQELKLNTVA